jgi:ABC-type uncharacterized transport system YnjBCD substrate-binding protein
MTKSPKSFRLSDRAIENLHFMVASTGANETALVEMALALLRHSFDIKKLEAKVSNTPALQTPGQKKKRKRH